MEKKCLFPLEHGAGASVSLTRREESDSTLLCQRESTGVRRGSDGKLEMCTPPIPMQQNVHPNTNQDSWIWGDNYSQKNMKRSPLFSQWQGAKQRIPLQFHQHREMKEPIYHCKKKIKSSFYILQKGIYPNSTKTKY